MCHGTGYNIHANTIQLGVGEAQMLVKMELRFWSWRVMAKYTCCYLVEGTIDAVFVFLLELLGGTLDQGVPDWTMLALSISLPHGGIVFGEAGWRWQEVERCASSSSLTRSLGGMVQRGHDVRRCSMDFYRAVVLSGAASMAGLTRSIA
jgi:hypothetical protein